MLICRREKGRTKKRRHKMLWLSHITVLIAGFVIGVLVARRNQKKVEKAIEAVKEEYKHRRG